jgi:hypothetical protein
MRQLSQIEKRLLRIVAVFDQMSATGATGDMAKTIESASNQARIMNEQFKETMTWTGQIVLMWLNNANVFQYINAVLITMKEVMRSMAYDMGYTEQNFLDGLVTSAQDAGEAVDDIQGKLLSFDKFEALNSKQNNIVGIDQTVLDLLEKINYQTEEFQMEANKIAQGWLNSLGFIDENGDGILDITQKARELLKTVKEIATVVGGLIGLKIVTGIGKFVVSLFTLNNVLGLLSTTLATGAIYAIIKAVEAFKEGDTWGGVFASVVGTVLVGAFIALRIQMMQTTGVGKLLVTLITHATLACGSFAGGIALVTGGFLALAAAGAGAFLLIKNWGDMSAWQKIIGVLGVATTAILGLAMALGAFHSAWSIGLAVTGIVAGIAMMTASIASVKKEINVPAYATGGFPEDGLFFANSGEMVGGFSNGRTAVANNDQIVTGITQGVYSAMMAYNAQTRGQGGSGDVYLDGTKVGRVVAKGSHSEMVRVGLIKANS